MTKLKVVVPIVVVLLGAAAGAVVATRGDDDTATADAAPTIVPSTSTTTTTTSTTATTSVALIPVLSTTTTAPPPAIATTLHPGSTGDDVLMVQERLTELGFVLETPDGRFGARTEHAVWAFRKLVLGVPATDLELDPAASDVTAELWAAMRDAAPIAPRRPSPGTHVEIYLPEQVLAVFDDDAAVIVAHISSGDGAEWCDVVTYDTDTGGIELPEPVTRPECGVGLTPPGVFAVGAELAGVRHAPNGLLHGPIFFDHTISITGADDVPLRPSTRGPVAVSHTIAVAIAAAVEPGDPVLVWSADGREPEDHSPEEMLPVFNSLDPKCVIGLYTLKEGDTRTVVAEKFDITEFELNGANGTTDGYLEFLPGLEIIIPPADCPPATVESE